MCNFGMNPDNFNPRVLYILKRRRNIESKNIYHSHDFAEVNYVISGSCTYHINSELYPVKKGDLIISNPGTSHGRLFAPDEEVTELLIGLTNISVKNHPADHLIPLGTCPILSPSVFDEDFYKCYSEIMLEQEKNEPGCELTLKALVMKLLVVLLKETCHMEKSTVSSQINFENYDKSDIVNAITSFISENYMQDISLDKISKNMYLSPVYISKIFKEETGDSPINYLIKVRLNKARELLEKKRIPVKSVAESVGYSDAYHFSKLYKKYFGCPPSKHKV